MVSKSKLFTRLDALEIELRERLIPHLELAKTGDNDLIFCVKGYHSIQEFKSYSDKTTSELVAIGSQILTLKDKLGESSNGTIAERVCWYCREWGASGKLDSKQTRNLASQFLNEIRQTL